MDDGGRSVIITGSANFTRRNLANFNLESNIELRGDDHAAPVRALRTLFDAQWNNRGNRRYSVPYETYEDRSWLRRWRYRFMEWSGLSTF